MEACDHDLLLKIATDVEWIKERVDRMDGDIEELKSFKWKIVGIASAAAIVVSSAYFVLGYVVRL